MNEALKHQIDCRIDELVRCAEQYFKQTFDCPTIGFRRSGRNAGTAHLQRNHINLNPMYLTDNIDEYLSQVIPHEVAHIIVYQRFGRVKPHGVEWQAVMHNVYQCPPHVTHRLDSSTIVEKLFNYRCQCGTVELTIRRHNKVQRGQQRYCCRRCKAELILSENQPSR